MVQGIPPHSGPISFLKQVLCRRLDCCQPALNYAHQQDSATGQRLGLYYHLTLKVHSTALQ